MTAEPTLELVSARGRRTWTRAQLGALPLAMQVEDAGTLVPGKTGRAVWLAALEAELGERADSAYVHVHSRDPGFAVSLPRAELASGALIVYELAGEPLPASKGGPFRLLVPGHSDECAHVKCVASIGLAPAPGRDTRPQDDLEHQKLHAKKSR